MGQPTTTNLPIALRPEDRQLLEGVAQIKRLKLSTWVRVAALEHSIEELKKRLGTESES